MNWFGVGGRFDGCVYRDNEWKWVDENHCIVAPNKPTCGSQRGQLSWRPPGGRFSKGKMTTPRREFFVSLFRFSTHVRLGFFFRARPVSQTDVSRVFFGRPTFYGNRRRKRQFGPTRWTVAKHGSRSLKKFPPKSSKEHSGEEKKTENKTNKTTAPFFPLWFQRSMLFPDFSSFDIVCLSLGTKLPFESLLFLPFFCLPAKHRIHLSVVFSRPLRVVYPWFIFDASLRGYGVDLLGLVRLLLRPRAGPFLAANFARTLGGNVALLFYSIVLFGERSGQRSG